MKIEFWWRCFRIKNLWLEHWFMRAKIANDPKCLAQNCPQQRCSCWFQGWAIVFFLNQHLIFTAHQAGSSSCRHRRPDSGLVIKWRDYVWCGWRSCRCEADTCILHPYAWTVNFAFGIEWKLVPVHRFTSEHNGSIEVSRADVVMNANLITRLRCTQSARHGLVLDHNPQVLWSRPVERLLERTQERSHYLQNTTKPKCIADV